MQKYLRDTLCEECSSHFYNDHEINNQSSSLENVKQSIHRNWISKQ